MMLTGELRRAAEETAATLPPLLSRASRLAASISYGIHGRRRSGPGETFWQFRQAVPGDPFSLIDWRRSAKQRFAMVRETEWEAAQSVWFWIDSTQSMSFRSSREFDTKRKRGALLALTLSILLVRAGERAGLLGREPLVPVSSLRQIGRIAASLDRDGEDIEYGSMPSPPEGARGLVVAMSDFLGDPESVLKGLRSAIERGMRIVMLQIVDLHEETFPYAGRVRFLSVGGGLSLRTEAADTLNQEYSERLAKLRQRLREVARMSHGHFSVHRTDESPRAALTWLAGAIEGQ